MTDNISNTRKNGKRAVNELGKTGFKNKVTYI